MRSASHPHAFLGVTESGLAAIVRTKGESTQFHPARRDSKLISFVVTFSSGNRDLHVILRGGTKGTNYDSASVKAAAESVGKVSTAEIPFLPAAMVDASHANSEKKHLNQIKVIENVCQQLKQGERGIMGVMVESNLEEGNQKAPNGKEGLKRGVSITDACVSWQQTVPMLRSLNEVSRAKWSVAGSWY